MTLKKNELKLEEFSSGHGDDPGANEWKLIFHPDGVYIVNDAGAETGPLSTSGGLITGSFSLLDGRYMSSGTQNFNIEFFAGDGQNVVSTGNTSAGYVYIEVPVNCIVDSWQVYADATGSIVSNILKSTASGFPPASPLAGLGQPRLTSQRKNSGSSTGTVSLSQGDVLQLDVSSVSTIKLLTVSLRARKA